LRLLAVGQRQQHIDFGQRRGQRHGYA
jgi:hypothetical protein